MKSEPFPITFLSNLEKDFKAEVIAAELVEHGTPEERIVIQLLGAMKRSFRKDVEAVKNEVSEYDDKEYVLIQTPREGFYDMLPEGLFHQPAAHKAAQTEREIIKIMKLRREEEQNARRFFIPFEAALNHLRVQMALYENRLDKRTYYTELANIFSSQWEIFQYLDTRQADLFLHLIPILHDIRDNHPVIETIMEMMFDLPVQLHLRTQLPLHPPEPIISKLGDSTLGIDATTGNGLYYEGVDEIVIKIGPVTGEVFQQFMPGKPYATIMELLCDYLLPVHLDVITEFVLDKSDKRLRFADEANTFNATLGADTYL